MSLTLFSPRNEASFEERFLDSLNFFQQTRISKGKSLLNSTNSIRVAQWMLQTKIFSCIGCVSECVYMVDENTPTGVRACCSVGRTRREDGAACEITDAGK